MRLLTTSLPALWALQLLLTASWSEAVEVKHDEEVVPFFADPEYSTSATSQPRHALVIHGGPLRGNAPTCASHGDCYNCTKTSGCHWCRDQHCYSHFSVHGCVSGVSCGDPDDDDDGDDGKKKKDKDACSEYATCSECGSTHTCHWCAHDDACHTIGSVYGCVRGVDCFSKDRCRRKVPEPLPAEQQTFTNMGFVPLAILGVVGFVLLCCTTTCWCCACGAKGAYDELCVRAYSAAGSGPLLQTTNNNNNNNNNNTPLEIRQNSYENQGTPNGDALLHPTSATASLITDDASGLANFVSVITDRQKKQEASTLASEEGSPPVQDGISDDDSYFYQAMEEEQQQEETTPLLPNRDLVSTEETDMNNHGPPKHATRMMRVCTCFYFIAVFFIGGLLFIAVRFFPKIPEYSECNDSVEWTNLIRSMATLSAEVDFEILMSIENANHLTVALDMGRGIFKHAGNTIGHYFIPAVEAAAMSITDVMIIATVSPQSWEALALTKEYYADKLVLHVDADVNVRIPTMFNYSQEVSLRDIPVKINRESDRHLCACKKWDGNNTRQTDIKELLRFDMQMNEVLRLP